MSDYLRDQIAEALYRWTLDGAGGSRLLPPTEKILRENSLLRADAVLAVVRPELDRLAEERDQAVAHDRQPYPTAWAYQQACKALEAQRERAKRAEAAVRQIWDWFLQPHPAMTAEDLNGLSAILNTARAALDWPAREER